VAGLSGRTDSRTLRNKLVEQYMHLVKYNAERNLGTPCRMVVELDDLSSAGIFGLMDAIDRLRPRVAA